MAVGDERPGADWRVVWTSRWWGESGGSAAATADSAATAAAQARVSHVTSRHVIASLTLYSSKMITLPHRIIWSWYTGRWWTCCYVWYSEQGTGRGRSPPRPILAVPNVTANSSAASVPITVLLCSFNVPPAWNRFPHYLGAAPGGLASIRHLKTRLLTLLLTSTL